MKNTPTKVTKFDASKLSVHDRTTLVKRIIGNMRAHTVGGTSGILLAGDPGNGKTAFATLFANLMGMNLISIEVPHILEEHIINIPYLVTDKKGKVKKFLVDGRDKNKNKNNDDFELILAQSNLMKRMKDTKKVTEKEYLKNMYDGSYGRNVLRIYEALGGTKKEIPEEIIEVREHFSTILFMDEFFRKTSTSIRNMLRGTINRQLGFDRIPNSVYVLFASNMRDEGIGDIPEFFEMSEQSFNRPPKDTWFAFMEDDAADKKYKMKEATKNLFWECIQDDKAVDDDDFVEEGDEGEDDEDSDPTKIWGTVKDPSKVAISARRLTQLMYYVDSSFPIKNATAAKALLTNVQANFIKFDPDLQEKSPEKTISSQGVMLMEKLKEMILESNDKLTESDLTLLGPYRWRDTLNSQIVRKLVLGETRKYIPVISGTFGIGKTQNMLDIAKTHKLGLIQIDCGGLSPEDITGTPLPTTDENGEQYVRFEESKLQKIIYEKAEALGEIEGSKEGYKYLIFFDELNRTKVPSFNALRQVLLEKKFDNGDGLPEKSIVVAAINPVDSGGGVTELTGHMLDVMDIIYAEPDWEVFYNVVLVDAATTAREKSFESAMRNVILEFSKTFSFDSKTPGFNLEINKNSMYMSPRLYRQIYVEGSGNVDQAWRDWQKKNGVASINKLKDEQKEEIEKILRKVVAIEFETRIKFILSKTQTSMKLRPVHEWFMHDPSVNMLQSFTVESIQSSSMDKIYAALMEDKETPMTNYSEASGYLANTDTDKIIEEVSAFIETISDADLFSKDNPMRFPVGDIDDDEYEVTSKVTPVTYLFRELVNACRAFDQEQHIEGFKLGSVKMLATVVKKHKATDGVQKLIKEMAVENFVL